MSSAVVSKGVKSHYTVDHQQTFLDPAQFRAKSDAGSLPPATKDRIVPKQGLHHELPFFFREKMMEYMCIYIYIYDIYIYK